jgi:NADPH-dependent 2,4-dienoyl-CoA reductase/sulfur reductase-like enzyme
MQNCDLIIVGAGPAGMTAASRSAELGMTTLILDEQEGAGGQIYKAVSSVPQRRAEILGKDYLAGRGLADTLANSKARHINQATVWRIESDGTVAWSRDGAGHCMRAKCVIIATGALERPVPIPGWTLPGVMTAGAAQILLKQSGVMPRQAVIAGAGPLLYLLAQQLVRAGQPPLAIVETRAPGASALAARHLAGAFRGWRYLAKGSGMLVEIRRAGVPRYTGCTGLQVEGDEVAQAIVFQHRGRRRRIECEHVLLHQGVVPNIQATRALGVEHVWDEAQRCFKPRLDPFGRTSNPAIYVAGDGGGIGGAHAAEHAGRLAALSVGLALGVLPQSDFDRDSQTLRRALQRELAIRPFLEALYAPMPEILRPADDTIVCRCEEVTAGDIRRYSASGCIGPNQTKAFGRCGMGPCQGRYCGLTVTEILAHANGMAHRDTGYYRIRMPLKPVTLGEMAAMVGVFEEQDAQQGTAGSVSPSDHSTSRLDPPAR